MSKKFLALGLVGLMTLSVGCDLVKDVVADVTASKDTDEQQVQNEETQAPEEEILGISEESTPEEIFELSKTAMSAQDAKIKMTIDMDMDIEFAKKGLIFTTEGNIQQKNNQVSDSIIDYSDENNFVVAINTNITMEMTGDINGVDADDNETEDTTTYIVAVNGSANKYTNEEDKWKVESISIDEARQELTNGMLDNLTRNAKSIEVAGSTNIDNQNCVSVKELMEWKSFLEVTGTESSEDTAWADSYSGDIELTYYFGEEDQYLHKIDIEFSDELIENLKENISQEMVEQFNSKKAECDIPKMQWSISFELYDFGTDNTIEVPQEALDAN